jgi:5-methylthioadenosine/S-adenosylhomocysteine deaminase
MGSILIKDGFIATMDKQQTVYQHGDVLIRDDRIVEISEKITPTSPPDQILDASYKVVLPGFINTHAHLQQYFRGLYELTGEFYDVNLPLEGYRQPQDMEYLGLASCAEFIQGGCTTSAVLYTYPDGFAKAAEQAGIRLLLAADIEEVNLERLRDGVYEYLPQKGEAGFQRALDLYRDWHGKADGRITTLMMPKAADLTLPETYRKCKEFADQHGLLISSHVSQSGQELRQVQKLYGKTPPQHLFDLGILGENFLAAHCAYTTEKDLTLIQKTGTRILQCRFLNSPFVRWMEMGIPISLGTDDYFHDMLMMFRELLAGQANRAAHQVESAEQYFASNRVTKRPGYYEMLELATRKGAEAIHMEADIGSLEVGKKADILLIDILNPFITPTLDPLTSIVLYGSSSDIKTVIVDGKILKQDGNFITLDLNETLITAQTYVHEIQDRFFKEHPHQKEIWEKKTSYLGN